jgi:hypothetical protein
MNAYEASKTPTRRDLPRADWPIDHARPVTGRRQAML